MDLPPEGLRRVAEGWWFDPGKVHCQDVPHLLLGFDMVAHELSQHPRGNAAVIRLAGVRYALTDFQPEGLTAAALLWATEELGLTSPSYRVAFVPPDSLDAYPNGYYLFDWMPVDR